MVWHVYRAYYYRIMAVSYWKFQPVMRASGFNLLLWAKDIESLNEYGREHNDQRVHHCDVLTY